MTTKIERQIAKEFGVPTENVCTIGSTLICGKGNDLDLLCLLPSDDAVRRAGFEPDLEDLYADSPLRSWRRDDVNLIVTHDRGFFLSEVAIAWAAKTVRENRFDMDERECRVRFHGEVRMAVSRHLSVSTDEPEEARSDTPGREALL